jgi:hypothetical protein
MCAMYCNKKTLYLSWESNKRFIHSPTRSRSPSPTSGRQTSPTLGLGLGLGRDSGRKNNSFISYLDLKELDSFDSNIRGLREVSEKCFVDALSISHNIPHNIPYKIQKVYIINDCRYVFKVTAYEVDIEKVKEQVTKYIQIFENINVDSISCDKYIANPENATVKLNCSTKDICIFTLLGRDKFSFTVAINNLEESPKHCFAAFRSLCKTDKLLTDLFEKSIVQYLDIARECVVPIISGIVSYNNGKL